MSKYSGLGTIWEALSPDPCLSAYAKNYKWLTQVYESVKPGCGNGKLLWHRFGAKTIELINENVHVETVRDDIELLVLDAEVLDSVLKDANPGKKAREVEIKLIALLKSTSAIPSSKNPASARRRSASATSRVCSTAWSSSKPSSKWQRTRSKPRSRRTRRKSRIRRSTP